MIHQFKVQRRDSNSTVHTQKQNSKTKILFLDIQRWEGMISLLQMNNRTQCGEMALSLDIVMHRAIMHTDTQALLQARIQHMQAPHSHPYEHPGSVSHTLTLSIMNNNDFQITVASHGAYHCHTHPDIHNWWWHDIKGVDGTITNGVGNTNPQQYRPSR